MPATLSDTTQKYDGAAAQWGDKMRLLGYYDAYLGFLSSDTSKAIPGQRVLDIGCGTGAMADAWLAIHRASRKMTLLDPSAHMLGRAREVVARRNVPVELEQSTLESFRPAASFDVLLAAHVIEHSVDPTESLRAMRDLVRKGGQLWLVASKPHWCNAIIWLQWRHKSYKPDQVEGFLETSGWALERTYAFPSGPPSRTSCGYLAHAI